MISVDTSGTYDLKFKAQDSAGNVATRNITVFVIAPTPPVISVDASTLVVEAASPLPDLLLNVSAYDTVDGDMTRYLDVDKSDLDLARVGEYTVVYTLTRADNAGLEAEPKMRTVRVVDTTQPVRTRMLFLWLANEEDVLVCACVSLCVCDKRETRGETTSMRDVIGHCALKVAARLPPSATPATFLNVDEQLDSTRSRCHVYLLAPRGGAAVTGITGQWRKRR